MLMDHDLVITNLWMEKKYKNYVYLKKSVRKKMYADVEALKADFLDYAQKHSSREAVITKRLAAKGHSFPSHLREEVLFIGTIMTYLKPGGRYQYQLSANFGKLLKDPKHSKLIGDCNQIVTLYSFLFSLKFPLKDLQIKMLPKHVCLHFKGIDIEATNGTFQKYKEHDGVLPITEIISTNILDVTDEEERTAKIDARTMLKRAHLAESISSNRAIVERNLKSAYHNLGLQLMRDKQFDSSVFFLEKLADFELLQTVYHNAALHFMRKKKYTKALYYANKKGDDKLRHSINYRQGAYYYENKQFSKAISFFRKIGDDRMVKACYQSQYSQQAKKVKHVKTIAQAKKFKSTYKKMLDLARRADNDRAEEWVRNMLKQL